jgi:catechol 2,3-dioxygenase-like lactoylglutathione lyase family enzyme
MKVCPCHHVHLFCTDLEATLAFWQQGFGLPLVRRRLFGADQGAELDLGSGVLLSVVQRSKDKRDNSVKQSGVDHLGMLVDDVAEALRHLASLPNVRIAREPFLSETYQCAFVAGPDDVLVEIQAPQK